MLLAGVSLLVAVEMIIVVALLTMVLSVVMLAVMVVTVLISDREDGDEFLSEEMFSPISWRLQKLPVEINLYPSIWWRWIKFPCAQKALEKYSVPF